MLLSIGLSTKRCSSLRYKLQRKGKSRVGGAGYLPWKSKDLLWKEVLQLPWLRVDLGGGGGGGSVSPLVILLFSLPTPHLGLWILAVG